MQHQNIKPGMVLKLKKEAIERYGENVTSPTYLVTGLRFRGGYKVPYVMCGDLFFRPSDFEKVVEQ
jgi:hypothetical protein